MTTTKELLAQLNALRTENGKAPLASWKAGMPKLEAAIDAEHHAMANRLADEQPSDPEVGQSDEAAGVRLLTPIPRGAIGAMSIELLSATDLPYDEIVARIKAVYPAAKTTARSLASVAMDLRRDGVDVPSRRKPAKAKQGDAAEAAGE